MFDNIKKYKYLFISFLALATTGCIEIEGVHYVNYYGLSDSGGYVLSMNSATYSLALVDDPNMFDELYDFSNPSITTRDGRTYLSDTSGYAEMEHFYQNFDCNPTPNRPNWSDCSFGINEKDWDFPNWSVDWTVVLRNEMELIDSNHHRSTTTKGKPTLVWSFDGNKTSRFDINFTVRVPND